MIKFVYGLFGFIYALISAPIFIIGTSCTETEPLSDVDPPRLAYVDDKLSPLGFGPSMVKQLFLKISLKIA